MLLLLAEKKDQATAYVKALQGTNSVVDKYVKVVKNSKVLPEFDEIHVVYLQGHVYKLKEPEEYDSKWDSKHWALETLPIFPKRMEFKLDPYFKNKRDIIVDHLKMCDEVYIATDPDTEGESIAMIFLQQNNMVEKVTGRLWQNSLTVKGLEKAFHSIRKPEETIGNARAGYCRMVADWLIGYNYSRLATLILDGYNYKGTFSIGRVQTPTLAIIAQRRMQRAMFKPVTSWRIAVEDNNGIKFLSDPKYQFEKQEQAQEKVEQVKQSGLTITDSKTEKKATGSSKLLVTSDLQGILIKSLKSMTAKKALNDVMEPLYNEKNVITYPRTACHLITVDDFNELKTKFPQFLKLYEEVNGIKMPDIFHQMEPRSKFVDFTGNKVLKAGHSALSLDVPINKEQYDKFTPAEQVAYMTILKSVLGMFADDYEYLQTSVLANDGSLEYKAVSKSAINPEKSWKVIFKDEQGNDENQVISNNQVNQDDYQVGTKLKISEVGLKEEVTKIPTAITEDTLIKTFMPANHLGTNATRGDIIERLFDRELIVVSKKKEPDKNLVKKEIMPTTKGLLLLQLMSHSQLLNLTQIRSWEDKMTAIAQGDEPVGTFLTDIKCLVQGEVTNLPNNDYKFTIKAPKRVKDLQIDKIEVICPKCKKGDIQTISFTREDGTTAKFYGCSNTKCKLVLPLIFDKVKLTPELLKKIFDGSVEEMEFPKKSGGTFKSKLVYDKGKITFEFAVKNRSKFKKRKK